MKFRLLTPGPTTVPEETLLELARPMVYHRTAEFRALLAEVLADLQKIYVTKNLVDPRLGGFFENALDEHPSKAWRWKDDRVGASAGIPR